MDGRILVFLALTLLIWLLNASVQRWNSSIERVKVPHFLACILGSKNHYIVWSSRTLQLAAFASFIIYASLLIITRASNLAFSVVIGMTLGVVLRYLEPQKHAGL